MADYPIKTFNQLVSDMVQWIVSNSSKITDLSPGSVIRSYCEAAGLCLEELYVSVYLGFRRYLDKIRENTFAFERKAGTKAKTMVVFSRAVATPDAKTAPIGTKVKTASGLIFVTTAVATINASATTSNSVEVEAEETGISYNVSAGAINIISDSLEGIDSVTNAAAATGGVDRETDYQYATRFQAYIEGLGRSNISGLIVGALSVEGITSASVQELFPPIANVNVRLYVDDGSPGGVSSALLSTIQGIIDGDGTDLNPGYRAAGVNVQVLAPTVVTVNVNVTVSVLDGIDLDQLEIDINTVVTDYINNLGVGSNVIFNELVYNIMNVYGVTDCAISSPSGNVSISATQVGRVGTITVVIS